MSAAAYDLSNFLAAYIMLCATLSSMNTSELLSHIDADISRLKEARALLAGTSSPRVARGGKPLARKKRTLSAEARARIAAAQRRRWAKQKKAAK
jgi:hypothetical protein